MNIGTHFDYNYHISVYKHPYKNALLCWWAGVGNDRSIADCISGCRNAIKIGQKLAKKEPLSLKYWGYITANPFPQKCTLPRVY